MGGHREARTRLCHSGMVRQHQTSDVQLHIGESLDSGFDASHRPGMTRGDISDVRVKSNLSNGIKLFLPVQSPLSKIFRFAPAPNHFHTSRHPVPLEGRFAIVTDVGTGCGGRECAFDERRVMRTAKSCGPDASTLASSLRKFAGDGDKQARSPGRSRRKPLKPLRAGMPGVPANSW
jgi:hypothetical protein